MTNKNLRLGAILVGLLIAAYLYQGPYQRWKEDKLKPKNFLAGIDYSQADKIKIDKGGETIELEKNGDTWKIGGTKEFPVKAGLAESLIASLESAAKGDLELVGENKDKKQEFGTGNNGAGLVLAKDGQNLLDIVVGDSPDFESTYISAQGSDQTYRAKANINDPVSASEWYDSTVFSSDKDGINRIRFQYPDSEFTVEKNAGGKWEGILPYKFKVDEAKIAGALDVMSDLQSAGFPKQDFAGTGLEKNSIIVQATGEGIDNTLLVGDKTADGQYFVLKMGTNNIYLITEDQRKELVKKIAELR